jgi:hypothetical protein
VKCPYSSSKPKGDVAIVRYADDLVMGFQQRAMLRLIEI